MGANDLTYQDYLDRISIQEALLHAGYTLNRRDGLRYPSYIRKDSDGRRIHGDKFIVTNHGTSCFRPPEQKTYNLISLIKTFPSMFPEHTRSNNPDHLVNEVCRALLHIPKEHKGAQAITQPREEKPFDLNDYVIHAFRKYDFDSIKRCYFARVHSTNWDYVVIIDDSVVVYNMNKAEFSDFLDEWATYCKDRNVIRMKATSGKMLRWFDERVA